jgi:hypothetical protein
MSSPKPLESRQSVAGCIASFTEAGRPDEPRRVPGDIKDRRIGTGTRRICRCTSSDQSRSASRHDPDPPATDGPRRQIHWRTPTGHESERKTREQATSTHALTFPAPGRPYPGDHRIRRKGNTPPRRRSPNGALRLLRMRSTSTLTSKKRHCHTVAVSVVNRPTPTEFGPALPRLGEATIGCLLDRPRCRPLHAPARVFAGTDIDGRATIRSAISACWGSPSS